MATTLEPETKTRQDEPADERKRGSHKLVVFGASGRTGRQLIQQALEQGHEVTALVRQRERLPMHHVRLAIVPGDVLVPYQVEEAIIGKDVVFSTIGVKPGQPPVCATGMRNILDAMRTYGVRRLIVESAYGVGQTKKGFYGRGLWLFIKELMQDKEAMEAAVSASDLDWLIVRPVALTDGPRTGKYRVGMDLPVGLWPTISRADVAEFMLQQLTDDRWLWRTPTIAY